MFHKEHAKKFFETFEVNRENKGDELVITIKPKKEEGAKEAVAHLDKKLGAMETLMEDCCGEGSCCC